MTDHELFSQAFDSLTASEDTYEEVLMKIERQDQPRHSLGWRVTVATLASTLVFGGTAFAFTNGLFASAFGSKGHENIPATALDDGKGGSITAPAMQFAEASEEDVARILGDAPQHVDFSCEVKGYTLTIDDLVMDEQGVGVATFTLTAPGGTDQFIGTYDDGYPDYGYLRYETGEAGKQLRSLSLRGINGGIYDHYEVVDLTQTTDEVLHGVMYFGAMNDVDPGGLVFGLAGVNDGDSDLWAAETDPFIPKARVDSIKLTDGQGHIAFVSPVGITYAAPFGEACGWPIDSDSTPTSDGAYAYEEQDPQVEDPQVESAGWAPNNTTIQLASGDPYVVESEDVFNSYCSYYTTNGAMTLVFNRLLDPELVASVTVDGPDGTTLTFSR